MTSKNYQNTSTSF